MLTGLSTMVQESRAVSNGKIVPGIDPAPAESSVDAMKTLLRAEEPETMPDKTTAQS